MRDLHGLADAGTPAYLTVWNRAGGTLLASRHSSDSGSMSTATVPSAYTLGIGFPLDARVGAVVTEPDQAAAGEGASRCA